MQILPKTQSGASAGVFVVTLVLSIVAVIFFVFPKYSEYKSKNDTLLADQKAVTDALAQKKTVESSIEKLKDSDSQFATLNNAIPNKADVPDVYAYLESLTKAAGLNLTAMQATDSNAKKPNGSNASLEDESGHGASAPSGNDSDKKNISPSPTLGVITVNMEMVGPIDAFKQLLFSLQNSLRIFDVQSVDIQHDKDTKMTINMVVKTYYQKSQ